MMVGILATAAVVLCLATVAHAIYGVSNESTWSRDWPKEMESLRKQARTPEENGIIELSNRTLREALDGAELTDLYQARDVIAEIVRWYNEER